MIRNRLPLEVHAAVFQWILGLAGTHKLLKGKSVGVDSTTLVASLAPWPRPCAPTDSHTLTA